MNKITSLLKEIRLREPADLWMRGKTLLLSKTGLLSLPSALVDTPPAIRKDVRDVFIRLADLAGTDGLEANARDAQNLRFNIFGKTVSFDGNVDWYAKLTVEGRWPQSGHWTRLSYKGADADIKDSWELSRHAHIVTLARAYHAFNDPSYAESACTLLDSWMDANAPERGIHFISNLEIALRGIAWLSVHYLLSGASAYTDARKKRVAQYLFYFKNRLRAHISYTAASGRNNHLIGDAAGLFALAHCLGDEASAVYALGILRKAETAQFLPGGLHFEGSPGYHAFVTEFYTLAGLLSADEKMQAHARHCCYVLTALSAPDGTLPSLNDTDNGFALPFYHSDAARLSLLQKIWTDAAVTLSKLSLSGLLVDKTEGGMLLMKNTPDPFPRSGHNHADLLNVLYWQNGKPVLIDSGTYRYAASGGQRVIERGTAAHNCITIDGNNQATPSRAFGWLSLLQPLHSHFDQTGILSLMDAAHASYEGVTHRRIVLWRKTDNLLAIIDMLQSDDAHQATQHWHFADLAARNITRFDSKYEPVFGTAPHAPAYGQIDTHPTAQVSFPLHPHQMTVVVTMVGQKYAYRIEDGKIMIADIGIDYTRIPARIA